MSPNDNPGLPPAASCPICGKPAARESRPFCSARCRTIDLGRWLKGSYRVETEDAPENGANEES